MSRTTNEEQKMNHKNASAIRRKKLKPAALTKRRSSTQKTRTPIVMGEKKRKRKTH